MLGVIASMFDGALIGATYGLAAIGLTLIWGVMDVINLTHGAVIALGMFGLYFLFGATRISLCRRWPSAASFLVSWCIGWLCVG